MSNRWQQLKSLGVLALTAVLVACGGGGGGGGGPTVSGNPPPTGPGPIATGSVGILLTDAPSDRFDQIVATITRIELIGGPERVTIFSGSEDVDLKALEQFSELFAVEDDVPAGTYTKIRLIIERLQLIELDENGNVEEKIDADLPANGKVDLLDRGGFNVVPDSSLIVQLDIDAKKSIKVQGTGSGRYKFRPVVFVDIIDADVRGRLVRVSGVVDDVEDEDDEQEFELCPFAGDRDYDLPCIDVLVGDATSIFDGNAEPVDFSSIEEGDELTAIGYLADEDDVEDDYGYGRREEDDDDDEDDDDYDDDDRHDFDDDVVLLAEVIELGPRGTFAVLEGAVTESLDEATGEFALEVFPGQGLGDMAELSAVLQPGGKIFSADGRRLDDTAVQAGETGAFDGVLSLSDTDPDVLKTVLGILDLEVGDDEVLRGIIQTVDEDEESFILATDVGDRCVDADDAEIFLVEVTDDGIVSNRGEIEDLMPGMPADVFGEEDDDGCFEADTVIAESESGDTAPPPVDDENNAPEADAGEDQEATVGDLVTLNGAGSSDPDNDPLTYSWSFEEVPEGSITELLAPDGPVTTFVPDVPGKYKVRLVVSDGELDDDDDVEVEVGPL